MSKYYVKLEPETNIIRDIITFPHGNYQEVELSYIPPGVNGGWWKLVDGTLVEIPELNPTTIDNQIQQAIDDYTLELIDGGVL